MQLARYHDRIEQSLIEDLHCQPKEFCRLVWLPAKSVVKVRMTVREPSEAKKSTIHPALTISANNSKNHFLDCEFEVVAGTYQGLNVWNNYIVSGHEKATNISMAFLRAALEAARGIDPKDSSQGATQARQLNDWLDFNGMEFPAIIGIKKPKAGDQYINNVISRAVTPDKPEYQQVMSGGEVISDTPIPEIPQVVGSAGTGTSSNQQTPQWGAGQVQGQGNTQSQPEQQSLLPNQGQGQPAANKPAWA